MRVQHKIILQIGQDTGFLRKLFYVEDNGGTTVIDEYLRQANSQFNIAATQTEAMSLGDVDSIKGIYIESDTEVKVYLNGSTDAIQLRKGPASSYAKLFIECDITQLSIENPDPTNPATGAYVVWGDV